jgi:hypothetical protein
MKIVKTSIDKVKKYQTDYLNSLPEFQELFIEIMINNSDYYLLDNPEHVDPLFIKNIVS